MSSILASSIPNRVAPSFIESLKLSRRLEGLGGLPIPVALSMWVVVAGLDWATTYEIYLSALYLALVTLVAWNHGLKWGVLFSVTSAANQAAIGIFDGNPFSSPAFLAIDLLNWLIAYLTVSWTFSHIRDLNAQAARYAASLEKRVRERTAGLEAANREMSAFCHSVAHDFRAPLRAMNAFSAIVLKDNRAKLDEASVDRLKRTNAASKRMGELIDDLLDLTRVSRQEMRFQDVDLSRMAESIADALRHANPEREGAVSIQPGMRLKCDNRLFRFALENLIGNAWKFTSGTAPAKIKIEARRANRWTTYSIRDNGAGFDMKYANRLFEPFERLHTDEQFEGTGIGLATAKRIIQRHKGDIWIESAPGVGTTVFFRLENERTNS